MALFIQETCKQNSPKRKSKEPQTIFPFHAERWARQKQQMQSEQQLLPPTARPFPSVYANPRVHETEYSARGQDRHSAESTELREHLGSFATYQYGVQFDPTPVNQDYHSDGRTEEDSSSFGTANEEEPLPDYYKKYNMPTRGLINLEECRRAILMDQPYRHDVVAQKREKMRLEEEEEKKKMMEEEEKKKKMEEEEEKKKMEEEEKKKKMKLAEEKQKRLEILKRNDGWLTREEDWKEHFETDDDDKSIQMKTPKKSILAKNEMKKAHGDSAWGKVEEDKKKKKKKSVAEPGQRPISSMGMKQSKVQVADSPFTRPPPNRCHSAMSGRSERSVIGCICDRLEGTVTCNSCGESFPGCIRVACAAHPMRVRFKDVVCCLYCSSDRVVEDMVLL